MDAPHATDSTPEAVELLNQGAVDNLICSSSANSVSFLRTSIPEIGTPVAGRSVN